MLQFQQIHSRSSALIEFPPFECHHLFPLLTRLKENNNVNPSIRLWSTNSYKTISLILNRTLHVQASIIYKIVIIKTIIQSICLIASIVTDLHLSVLNTCYKLDQDSQTVKHLRVIILVSNCFFLIASQSLVSGKTTSEGHICYQL